uniref:Uncharacterized protein n=4 Tax=Oryza sativa subsp. japonica TaxID=39947 RepID=Q10F86_ORYSJ|nr:hypothetical protein [Oryza sativa Japonica Group]ABF98176.1 hypothetical protein LOC_Os03g47380 [Oryza sativa Japonica Group]
MGMHPLPSLVSGGGGGSGLTRRWRRQIRPPRSLAAVDPAPSSPRGERRQGEEKADRRRLRSRLVRRRCSCLVRRLLRHGSQEQGRRGREWIRWRWGEENRVRWRKFSPSLARSPAIREPPPTLATAAPRQFPSLKTLAHRTSLFTSSANAPAPAKEHGYCELGCAARRASAAGTTRGMGRVVDPLALFKRPSPSAGEFCKWVDWELPCYLTSFLTVVILGIRLNAKPNFTLQTRPHQKERQQATATEQQELVSMEAQTERSARLRSP